MKLICSQSDLSSNLSLVSRAVPSRPTHPVLANILLQADAETNQVSLTAFDLSLGIRTSFTAEVLEGGTIALPAKLLVDITSRLPEGEITLDDQSGDNTGEGIIVTLKPKSGRYQVRAMGAEEFPELPVIENAEAITLTTAALIEGLKGSLFATSSDETKQVLTGVHLTLKQDTLEFKIKVAYMRTHSWQFTTLDDKLDALKVMAQQSEIGEEITNIVIDAVKKVNEK